MDVGRSTKNTVVERAEHAGTALDELGDEFS